MSKLLEHLEIIEDWANEHHDSKKVWKHSIPIQEALQRLEAIDNANPSEALKCLESMSNEKALFRSILSRSTVYMGGEQIDDFSDKSTIGNKFKGAIPIIKQALIKAQEREKELADVEMVKSGKTIIHIGKDLVMMNKAKYKEYVELENEPVSKRILQAKCEEQEKAWEIVRKKNVDISYFLNCLEETCGSLNKYNELTPTEQQLLPNEFDLLKEVLK